MIEYWITKNKKTCYGCCACEDICSTKAISMEADDEGFLYPVVNEALCTQCGACSRVCPYSNNNSPNEDVKVYAAKTHDDDILEKSSSGGVFFTIAENILNCGGLVCGCVFDDMKAVHILTDDIDTVKKMRGSKYVQSNTRGVFKPIKKALNSGRIVLFTGTPCQVQGIKEYVGGEHPLLYTLDLICHGVPSQFALDEYLNYIRKSKGNISALAFRDKRAGGWGSRTISYASGKTESLSALNDGYYQLFLRSYILRESCYECKFCSIDRCGDITIGDFWNANKYMDEKICDRGVSVILVNTHAGSDLLSRVEDNLFIREFSTEIAAANNGNLMGPSERPVERDLVYTDIRENGFEYAAKKYCKFQMAGVLIRRLIPSGLKKILKKILK